MGSKPAKDTWTLRADQIEIVEKHLEKFMINGCWVCQNNDWIILPRLSGEKPYDPEAEYFAIADSAPKVRITCKNCGNAVYFSSEVIGLNVSPPETSND
jgi:hypothetical protein